MNDKRKEYLKKWWEDNKEHIKNYKKEYAKTHDSSFKKLQNKYKQLQQENEILQEEIEEYKNPIKYFKYANKNVTGENQKYKEVIDKLKDKIKENIENAECEVTTLTIGDKMYYQYIEKILDNYVDILKEVE